MSYFLSCPEGVQSLLLVLRTGTGVTLTPEAVASNQYTFLLAVHTAKEVKGIVKQVHRGDLLVEARLVLMEALSCVDPLPGSLKSRMSKIVNRACSDAVLPMV